MRSAPHLLSARSAAHEGLRLAEALAEVGEELSLLGFEEEGMACFVVAGDLLARVGCAL
jgi:hypothetical protein